MAYSIELQKTIDALGISKENILYLTLENIYMQEMREGIKDTEYREGSEFILSRLFKRNKDKKFQSLKPKTHILFQGGYNPDSPRLLIEMLGFSVGGQQFPPDKELKQGYRLYEDLELYLGKIAYDSLADSAAIPAERKPAKQRIKRKPADLDTSTKKSQTANSVHYPDLPKYKDKRRLKIIYNITKE
ncbi:hypothetical protein [Kaistella palustris]|uniref:hypothetical protein n=1 Tax=Kaistella palustris TaxID=493376 RepID=UPI00040DB990|nr:hypothetical protein [Kaistella palustris]